MREVLCTAMEGNIVLDARACAPAPCGIDDDMGLPILNAPAPVEGGSAAALSAVGLTISPPTLARERRGLRLPGPPCSAKLRRPDTIMPSADAPPSSPERSGLLPKEG